MISEKDKIFDAIESQSSASLREVYRNAPMVTAKKIYKQVTDGFPDGWEESAIVSSVTTNGNGTLTVRMELRVDAPDGRRWHTFRKLKLERVEKS